MLVRDVWSNGSILCKEVSFYEISARTAQENRSELKYFWEIATHLLKDIDGDGKTGEYACVLIQEHQEEPTFLSWIIPKRFKTFMMI